MNERPLIWLTIGTLPAVMAAAAAHREQWPWFAGFVFLTAACAGVSGVNFTPRTFHARHATRRKTQ